MGGCERELAEDLALPLGSMLGTRATIQDVAFDIERFLDPQRLQYNSTNILIALGSLYRRVNGGTRSKVLAVTGEDLFIPILTYVFGEAQLGGDFAVVSYHRLQPERYGLAADRGLLLNRLFKESLHELGHTYGLVHCRDQECVMRTSTYAEDIDLKGSAFCRDCRASLGVLS